MMLAAVDTLVDELGFDAMSDITSAATGAMNAATTVLEARLGTVFDKNIRTDMYYVNEPGFVQGNGYTTEFRLRQGFVQSVASVIRAESLEALPGNSAVSYMSSVIIDKELGRITDYSTYYYRHFVQISYTAGFDVSGANPERYEEAQVPAWLREAAKLTATVLLSDHPVMTQAQLNLDTKTLNRQAELIISRHVRYTPVAMLPM